MIMLPNREKVSDDETKYEGISPLVDENDESQEKYTINEQVGLGLVTRRALIAQRKEDHMQRENIFYTRCLIKDRVCSLIIDRGSYTNVASTLMVEKLELATTDYP